ncbi:MAG: glycine betaine/proline transport system substrate-binding protein, partial [Chloroflexota bacterium]|nr:glycine betaine/proline transport system substrate-binding protein [Chloroflexota bacterium]
VVMGCARAGATPTPSAAGTATSGAPASAGASSSSAASPAASAVAAATCTGAGDKGEIKMMVNEWVGAAANVAVAQCLLQQMGYKVTTSTLAEEVAWQGFDTGDVDVILENWGHPDLEKKYIQETKLATDAGPMGVKGIIGWYVPKWMVDKYPDITDWNNLNKYADLFKTSESGDKGQFLGASPAFVQYDEALIANLKLNYKVVFSGSEAASITAFQKATKDQTPLIGYFYDPQWLLNEIELVQVHLPPWTEGCDADLKKVACDYPSYTLNKIVRTKWLDTAGDAGTFIKNFKWSNADQNSVADAITNKNMKELDAAKVWIDANAATWQAWMP